jgi:ketosteroid isomerase-like protein
LTFQLFAKALLQFFRFRITLSPQFVGRSTKRFFNAREEKMRTKIIMMAFALLLFPAVAPQTSPVQTAAPSATVREITAMLNQFLQIAAKNDVAGFDRFFADDVIYTHSAGTVTNKAEIMRSVTAGAGRAPRLEVTTTYSAEDVTIHEYPDVAIAAFRLVSDEEHSAGKPPTITKYRNTGTFLRRNGRWQVIAWQSTKIPDGPAS